jgi:hypothetical protein
MGFGGCEARDDGLGGLRSDNEIYQVRSPLHLQGLKLNDIPTLFLRYRARLLAAVKLKFQRDAKCDTVKRQRIGGTLVRKRTHNPTTMYSCLAFQKGISQNTGTIYVDSRSSVPIGATLTRGILTFCLRERCFHTYSHHPPTNCFKCVRRGYSSLALVYWLHHQVTQQRTAPDDM